MSPRYLIVMTAAAHRTGTGQVAIESALVEHLRTLRTQLGTRFSDIDIAMAEMSTEQYAENRQSMTVIDEQAEHIHFTPLFRWQATKARFIAECPRAFARLASLVKGASLVHSHLSYDLWRPVELMATSLAVAMGKTVISITDMDNRRNAEMNYELGRWSFRPYAMCKYIYDPLRDLQQRAIVKACDLVLFKEIQQVEHYGRGASHVRLFLDPNFLPAHIASDDVVAPKLAELDDPSAPLRVLYFGRLVAYKGVDRMIDAVALAKERGANIRFSIMGSGSEEASLRALVKTRGIEDIVDWVAPREYGPAFFEVLRERHLLLACPLAADTPRSTWDALASGVPILAFATPFYSGIAKYTGAVDVVKWPETAPLAARLVSLANDKSQLVPMVRNAVAAARANTGEEWMKRRVNWVVQLLEPKSRPQLTHAGSPFARVVPPVGS